MLVPGQFLLLLFDGWTGEGEEKRRERRKKDEKKGGGGISKKICTRKVKLLIPF